MKYFCFAIDTTTEAEDVIAYMLSDRLGIDSVEFDDNEFVDDSEKEGGFFPELQPDTPAHRRPLGTQEKRGERRGHPGRDLYPACDDIRR